MIVVSDNPGLHSLRSLHPGLISRLPPGGQTVGWVCPAQAIPLSRWIPIAGLPGLFDCSVAKRSRTPSTFRKPAG